MAPRRAGLGAAAHAGAGGAGARVRAFHGGVFGGQPSGGGAAGLRTGPPGDRRGGRGGGGPAPQPPRSTTRGRWTELCVFPAESVTDRATADRATSVATG